MAVLAVLRCRIHPVSGPRMPALNPRVVIYDYGPDLCVIYVLVALRMVWLNLDPHIPVFKSIICVAPGHFVGDFVTKRVGV